VGWSENGVDLVVMLPQIGILNSNNVYALGPNPSFPVYTSYDIKGATDYVWGINPQLVSVNDNSVEWRQPLQAVTVAPDGTARIDTSTESLISVNNPGASHTDNVDLFLAGAFIGIAGAAFLTVIDAATEPLRSIRRIEKVSVEQRAETLVEPAVPPQIEP